MKVAYVFERFPCPSETFALREIECLRSQGCRITVLCRKRLDDGMRTSIQIITPPAILSLRWLCALGHLLVRRWKRLPGLVGLWCRLAIRSPRRAAGLLLDLHMLGDFSKAVTANGIEHVHGYWLGWPARTAAALSVLAGVSMSLSGHARDIFIETPALDILARRASFIAVCTDQGLWRLRDVLGSVYASKLHLVRHGLLPQEMATSRPTRGRDSAAMRIVAVGRLVEKKGFDVLLRAFAQIKARDKDAGLTIIGDGPQRASQKALANRLALDGCVTFGGWLSHDEAMACIRQADMLVVPSVIAADGDRDGVPNVILEAFASGTPVIASRLPGIEEAVEHGTSGLLASPGDPADLAETVCRLIVDRDLAEKLARGGRRVLEERFDAMANSGQLAALFAEAMKPPC